MEEVGREGVSPWLNEKKGQKVCSVIQDDTLGISIDKDMHCECTGQMGAKKYLRKGCYHHTECSTSNSLTAFMWRMPLNSATYLGHPNSQRACKGVRWNKHSSSGLNDRQVEGQDHSKGDI